MKNHLHYGIIANRYAKAVFELAHEEGKSKEVLAEFELFEKMLSDMPMLPRALQDEKVALASRLAIISDVSKVLSLSPLVCNTLLLLIQKDRFHLFAKIIASYRTTAEHLERLSHVSARIADANLTAIFQERIEKILFDILKHPVQCDITVDSSLIGGAVVRMGDISLDASVSGRLEKMREELL